MFLDPTNGNILFHEWAAIYDEQTPRRATTTARDGTVVKKWLSPTLGSMRLASITPTTVRGLVKEMSAQLAPATVRTNYGVLRAILNAAVEADLIARNPCRGIRLPAERRTEIRFLSADEVHRLADAMPVEYAPMVYVVGVLGLRWSEVAGLRVKRIDFLRRTLTVAETVAEVNGQPAFADVKTKTARRTLGMPPELADMVAAHLARRGRPGPEELVFVAPGGGPLRASNFRQRVWRPAIEQAGLEGLTFHGLRHSAVGLMIELGAHIEAIKQRMGHSSIRVTSDVYGSLLPSVDEAVAAGLGARLWPEEGTDAVQAPDI